jgi:hypothetical protein
MIRSRRRSSRQVCSSGSLSCSSYCPTGLFSSQTATPWSYCSLCNYHARCERAGSCLEQCCHLVRCWNMAITLLHLVCSYRFSKCTSIFVFQHQANLWMNELCTPVACRHVAVMFHCSWLHGRNQYCIKSHHPSALGTLSSYLKFVDNWCRPSCCFEILFFVITQIVLT